VGRYFDIVTGELEKGSETYKLWTELYPDEWRSYNALANDANLLGRYDTVVDASKQAVLLEPNHNFGYINLLSGLIALNRIDEAKAICEQLIGQGHDDAFVHLDLFAIASLRHDGQALSREYDWAEKHPDDSAMRYALAEADAAMGKVKQSAELFEQAAKLSAASGNSEAAANTLAISAEINSEMGRATLAQKKSDDAVRLGKNQIVLGLGALIASRAGNEKRANELLDELDHDYPLSTFNIGLYSPMTRTTLAVAHGSSAPEITNLMEPALPYEFGEVADLLPIYVRGISYLQVRSGKDAEREFQRVLDHHAVDAVTTLYPLSQLGLARCYALLGRKEDSRRAYEAFFTLWKDADRDLPILVKARREYQGLK
jgi:eukaryotic-like serine/threonine-protein kinase